MKIKSLLKSALMLAIIAIFMSGCGSKYNTVAVGQNSNLIKLGSFSSLSDYGFVHKRYGNSATGILQHAAMYTIFTKNKYFVIVEPEKLANRHGVMINTAEEYLKKCTPNITGVFVGGLDPCNVHLKRGRGWTANIQISVYKEEQEDFLVYDAKKVLNHLKSIDMYDPDLPISKFSKFYHY